MAYGFIGFFTAWFLAGLFVRDEDDDCMNSDLVKWILLVGGVSVLVAGFATIDN